MLGVDTINFAFSLLNSRGAGSSAVPKLAAQRAVAAAAGKSAAARVFQQPFLKLIPTMKQTVFAETQKALPKPAVCDKPKAPAKDKPLTFDSFQLAGNFSKPL